MLVGASLTSQHLAATRVVRIKRGQSHAAADLTAFKFGKVSVMISEEYSASSQDSAQMLSLHSGSFLVEVVEVVEVVEEKVVLHHPHFSHLPETWPAPIACSILI
jgi:hypothetical protein